MYVKKAGFTILNNQRSEMMVWMAFP